jgi:hypothetical protein
MADYRAFCWQFQPTLKELFMAKNHYYSGQGSLLMAERDPVTGNPMGFLPVGNVPELTLNIEVTKYEHKESETGARLVDLVLVQEKKGTFEFKLENLNLDNMAMGLWGEKTSVAAGTVATLNPEIVTLGKYVGGAVYALRNLDVSSVVITDSTGVTTYTSDDYAVDAKNGTFTVKAGGALATATATAGVTVKCTYSYGASTRVDAFTKASAPERWLRFQGINTIDDTKVVVDLFRAQFDPMTGYSLINEELGSVTISGTLLADTSRETGSKFFAQRNLG